MIFVVLNAKMVFETLIKHSLDQSATKTVDLNIGHEEHLKIKNVHTVRHAEYRVWHIFKKEILY